MKRCTVCPNNCLIEHSVCGRKNNINENLVETTAVAIDPIEKKPLYHFMPGSRTLSIGTLGCNLKCLNCQNHTIAQPRNPEHVRTETFSSNELVEIALNNNLKSISWTYNEPTLYPEWIVNTAKIAQEHDIKTILVTNGYTSYETLKNLVKYVDAVNVDLKSMDDAFYKKVCSGHLKPVLDSIKFYYENNIHLEVTTLLIPEYNTNSVKDVVKTIEDIDINIPLHFSAFYPQYKLSNIRPTDEEIIFDACNYALEHGLNYVYAGNTYSSEYDNTYCNYCHELLIERDGYHIKNNIVNEKCPNCKKKIMKI